MLSQADLPKWCPHNPSGESANPLKQARRVRLSNLCKIRLNIESRWPSFRDRLLICSFQFHLWTRIMLRYLKEETQGERVLFMNSIAWKRWLLWNKWILLQWSKKRNVDGDKLGWWGKQQQANHHIYLIFIWLVMSLWFVFGDNYWNDAHPPSWSRFGFLTMVYSRLPTST